MGGARWTLHSSSRLRCIDTPFPNLSVSLLLLSSSIHFAIVIWPILAPGYLRSHDPTQLDDGTPHPIAVSYILFYTLAALTLHPDLCLELDSVCLAGFFTYPR